VNLSLLGAGVKLRDMTTGKLVEAKAADSKADAWRRQGVPARTEFAAAVAPTATRSTASRNNRP
jgi:hypothetical protein